MKTKPDIKKELETLCKDLGAAVFGVADLDMLIKSHPNLLNRVPGQYSYAVVCGVRLQDTVLDNITDRPTPLYFHNYRQANYQLDRIAFMAADRIQKEGYLSLAVPASQIIIPSPMSGHISHKLLGYAAGLGFYGRSSLLVNPEYGARLRYVSVLTNMPLTPDQPIQDNCGSCTACVSACPAKAIKEKFSDFDLNACYAKLSEFARLPFVNQHICGVCVKACCGSNRRSHGKSTPDNAC